MDVYAFVSFRDMVLLDNHSVAGEIREAVYNCGFEDCMNVVIFHDMDFKSLMNRFLITGDAYTPHYYVSGV